MVLLLREPHRFTREELCIAAEKAWSVSFAGSPGSNHFVMQAGHVTFVKTGPHVLNLFHVSGPYLDDPEEISKGFPPGSSREAWAKHRAWAAVDYLKGGRKIDLEYAVIAKLVAEMLDSNCTGVYIPGENVFLPNDPSLRGELQNIAANDLDTPN